ncbi:MAG: GvpL/GvpF family gas vesicle protein [Prolixibacteraceae bacterium]
MGKLIYAILTEKHSNQNLSSLLTGMRGLKGQELLAVSCEEIIAIISNVDKVSTIPERSGAIEYAGIIEHLSQYYTLLPMRYGSIMETPDDIKNMLGRNYEEIHQNLMYVQNKFEFGLKILCDFTKLKTEIQDKSPIHNLLPETQNSAHQTSIYRNWVNKKLHEHRLEELVVTYVDSIINKITTTLNELNSIQKFKKMVTESILVDSVFLLDKELKNDLLAKISALQNQFPELNFVLTGPWPPYSFVKFQVK